MKKLSPGRIYNVCDILVRAKRQSSCNGCLFDNLFGCPRIKDCKNSDNKENIRCKEDGVIFVKP